jgi:hypothetical protein
MIKKLISVTEVFCLTTMESRVLHYAFIFLLYIVKKFFYTYFNKFVKFIYTHQKKKKKKKY